MKSCSDSPCLEKFKWKVLLESSRTISASPLIISFVVDLLTFSFPSWALSSGAELHKLCVRRERDLNSTSSIGDQYFFVSSNILILVRLLLWRRGMFVSGWKLRMNRLLKLIFLWAHCVALWSQNLMGWNLITWPSFIPFKPQALIEVNTVCIPLNIFSDWRSDDEDIWEKRCRIENLKKGLNVFFSRELFCWVCQASVVIMKLSH